jgi:ubiquinone/menaquinone biosynthesis C-methylase UbiE
MKNYSERMGGEPLSGQDGLIANAPEEAEYYPDRAEDGEGAEQEGDAETGESGEVVKRQEDEEELETLREKIKSGEAEEGYEIKEDISERMEGVKDASAEKEVTPSELFDKCRSAEFRAQQEKQRGAREKLVNSALENRYTRQFRQERADETLEGVSGLLDKVREAGRTEIVVDIGCGQCEIARAILDYFKETDPGVKGIGIDKKTYVAPERLGEELALLRGDVLDSKLEAGSVDLLNCHYLLQALDETKQREVLAEMRRLLSENGHVLFMDVVKREGEEGFVDKLKHQVLNAFATYNIRSEEGWKAFLEENGFEVLDRADVQDRCVAFLLKVKRTVEVAGETK